MIKCLNCEELEIIGNGKPRGDHKENLLWCKKYRRDVGPDVSDKSYCIYGPSSSDNSLYYNPFLCLEILEVLRESK